MTLDDFETGQTLRLLMGTIPLVALTIAAGVEAYRQYVAPQSSESTPQVRNSAIPEGVLENSRDFVYVNGIKYGVNDFYGLDVNQRGIHATEQYDSDGRSRTVYVTVK